MSASKYASSDKRHGRSRTFIDGEGWVEGPLCSPSTLQQLQSRYGLTKDNVQAPDPIVAPEPRAEEPTLRFCRLIPKGPRPSEQALIALGQAMETEVHGVGVQGDSNIPAGYTYLGQFIDHDITAEVQDLELGGPPVDPGAVENRRTPSLDLDSLYGRGPEGSPDLYEADGVRLRVGRTAPTLEGEPGGPIAGGFPNDLPRREGDTEALIGDPRNDENLAVAQTHLAFLKFHNRTVERLRSENPGIADPELFERARREVTLRYQSILLNDFLPRLIETDVLQEVIACGPRLYDGAKGDCMPVEVAAAAFRLGHSMVRPSYEWNRVFNSDSIPATFELLFEFSGVSGSRGPGDTPFLGKPALPSNWITDWTRLYDFGPDLPPSENDFRNTRKLDVHMAMALAKLPEFEKMATQVPPPLLSLATRNLLRGRQFELPTGEQAADALREAGYSFTPVPSGEIANGAHRQILEDGELVGSTPLWYYILREGKVRHDGNRLGPVGSILLAEFFVGAVRRSKISILDEPGAAPFTMPQLLLEVGDLNPLGPAA